MSYGDSAGFVCCRWCSSFLLTSGFTALFLWLSLRPSSPKCYLRNFTIPPLNRSLPNPPPANVSFELRLVNPNVNKGIYYDPVKVSFFRASNRSNPLGNFTIPGFYQGHQKKATKSGVIVNATGEILRTTDFRVEIATRVRYKLIFFKTKRHGIAVGSDFQVNDDGKKVASKDVRLKSGGDRVGGGHASSSGWLVGVLLSLFFLVSSL
ncbi:Protein NDR1 [Linum grandiflorum]